MKNVHRLPDFSHMQPPSGSASGAIAKMKMWMQYKRYDLLSICDRCNAATYFMRVMQINSPDSINETMLMIFETKESVQHGPFSRKRKQLFEALRLLLHANNCSEDIIDSYMHPKKRKRAIAA